MGAILETEGMKHDGSGNSEFIFVILMTRSVFLRRNGRNRWRRIEDTPMGKEADGRFRFGRKTPHRRLDNLQLNSGGYPIH